MAKRRRQKFIEWFREQGIRVPAHVDPSPFTRADFETPKGEPHGHGAYNAYRLTKQDQTKEDYARIREMGLGLISWCESRGGGKGKQVEAVVEEAGDRYYQATKSDCANSWDDDRYKKVKAYTHDIEDSWWRRTLRMPVGCGVVIVRDRKTGDLIIYVSVHTQVRGMRITKYGKVMKKQYAQIEAHVDELEKEYPEAAILISGDFNNGQAEKYIFKGWDFVKARIDYIFFRKSRIEVVDEGTVWGIGFDHKRDKGDGPMHSDHPLKWMKFFIKK